MDWITVTPAYGRDYKNQKEALKDWREGKDFRDTVTGQYINKEGADRLGLKVILRFCKNTKTANASK